MDISEFNQEEKKPKNLMADFSTNVEEPKPLINEATTANLAAHAAALAGPSRMKETFDTVKDELNYGESNVISRLMDEYDRQERVYRESALKSIITDPDIDVDTKAKAVENFDKGVGRSSLASRVGAEALSADSDPEETPSEEDVRFDVSSWLDEFDVYNGMVQSEMNNIDKATPTRVDQDVEEFVLTFIPFYESYKFTELVDQIKQASDEEKPKFYFEAFLMLGHEKEEMRNAIKMMPVEKRTKVARFILDYAKKDLNIHSMRGNKMLMMRNLEEMLGIGSYSDTDKWIDTAAALAESILPLAPKAIKTAVKGGKAAAKRGSNFARQKRYEDAVKRLEDKEVTASAAQKAEEGKQALKDAKTPEEKEAVIKSTGDAVADDIIKNSPKRLGIDEAAGIRSAVQVTTKELEVLEAGEFAGKVAELFKRVEGPKAIVEPPKKGFRLDVITDYIRSKVSPISISQVYKNTNPNRYRQLDQIIAKDPSDEAAQLLTGASRTDALVDARMPQVGKEDGAVAHKVDIYDGHKAGKEMIKDLKESSGRLELSTKEKRSLRYQVEGDFRGISGVNVNTAMTTVKHTDQGVKMSMAYSPKNGGYASASRAKDDVVKALSKYGIDHNDVVIKRRNSDGTYTEVDKAKRGIKDYIATVDFDYNFSPTDLKNFDRTESSGWSLFDVSIPGIGKLGTIQQSAIVDNLLFRSASRASDKVSFIQSKLLNYAQQFADSFSALDKRQQALVTDYIIEANEKGLKLDPTSLEVKGFSKKSIEALRQWRQVNDILYQLDNWDLNKSLRAKGFERIVSKKGDVDLIATPATKSSVNSRTRVYDPEIDAVRTMTSQELDELYDAGGNVYKTRGRIDFDEDSVEHVLVNQKNVYSRGIKDTDQTLSYRDGHYHVDYKDPIFIKQKFVDADGNPYTKAIATAPTRADALKYTDDLAKDKNLDPDKDFELHFDKRNSEGFEDLEWSMAVNMGRTTQKVRGKRLANSRASSDVTMKHSHIETPEESLLKSIHSLSNRTAFRDWIDTSKKRFIDQFGHLLEKKDMWPEDVSLVKAEDIRTDPKEIRNAKSTWEYINTMENGYTDLLSDASKYLFKKMSDTTGRAGFGWAETGLSKASDFNINRWGRRKAFRLMIGTNVFQLATQSSQVLPIVGALNPAFLPKVLPQLALLHGLEAGTDAKTMLKMKAEKLTGLTVDEAIEMEKHYRNSGIAESLSADTFVREHMHSLVDRTKAQKFNTLLDKPINFLQKIGFETGTNILMKSVWLSEYDLLRKAGTKITPEVLDELGAKVRALTADENRAGEMAYSQNMFSTVTQFLATPHKMFGQMILGHRGLTKTEMNKLRASYLLTYGTGAGVLTDYAYNLYRDMFGEEMPEEIRHAVEGGVFQTVLNTALSALTGQDVNVGFSDRFRIGVAQPNIWRFVEDMVDLNVPSMISGSPAGSLVFGDSPKFTTFVDETMRIFTVPEYETKEQAFTAAKSFLTMFPTASNSLKAYYILKWAEEHEGKGRSVGRSGVVHDYDVNTVEALMKIAGFNTMDELMSYRLKEGLYRQGSEPYDDVEKIVREVNVRTAMDGVARGDPESAIAIVREVQRVFQDHPVYNKIMLNVMKKQAEDSDNNLIRKLLVIAQTSDEDSLENLLRSTQLSENQKEFLRDLQRRLGKE